MMKKRRQPAGEPSILYSGCGHKATMECGAPPSFGCVDQGDGGRKRLKDVIVNDVDVELEERADQFMRYLSLRPDGTANLRDMILGRDPALLRLCLRKRLVKILPTGAKRWQDGEIAADLPLDEWLERLDLPESRSMVAVGEAGRAILDVEFQNHHGQPEKMAAKARRIEKFRMGA